MKFRSRLILSYICILFLALATAYVWTEWWMAGFYEETVAADLEGHAGVLSSLLSASSPGIDQLVDAAAEGSPLRITVIDPNGRVVADSALSGTALDGMEDHSKRAEIVQARNLGIGRAKRFSTSTEESFLYVAARLKDGSGIVRVALPLGDIETVRSWLRKTLLAEFGLLSLVGIGAAWLIGRNLTRAVTTLSQAVRRIAGGELLTQIPLPSKDDLGQLARDMEGLAARLHTQMAELGTERNSLAAILNSMSEGVMVTDHRGRISQANPAFQRIFPEVGQLAGRMPIEAVRNLEVGRRIESVLNSNQEQSAEIKVRGKVLAVRFTPLGTGSLASGVLTVFHDITQLRRLESVRKDFISNVSHELRTPLTSIHGYAETLLQEEKLDPELRGFIERIHRNSRVLSEAIEELFSLARLESGEQSLVLAPVDFERLMSDLKAEFGPSLEAKGLEFSVRNLSGESRFLANEAYLRRVFHNLLENAVSYTDAGSVEVALERVGSDLRFSVQDTGIGIPEEDLERVFDRFYRVDWTSARAGGGRGVGLAVVKHLVQLHGGRVWAESEVGRGTKILFVLPWRESGESDHDGTESAG